MRPAPERIAEEAVEEIFHAARRSSSGIGRCGAGRGGACAPLLRCRVCLGRYSVEMFTTEGSTVLAICRELRSKAATGLGMASGVAPGATVLVFRRLDAGVNQRADHHADSQREQDQRERQKLLSAHLVEETHGLANSSAMSGTAAGTARFGPNTRYRIILLRSRRSI